MKDKVNAFLCRVINHKWRFNFPATSLPNRAICSRCYAKAVFDLRKLEWEEVKEFNFANDNRTDKQLSEQWFSAN